MQKLRGDKTMDMLNKIIAWAQKESAIRTLVLTGSRAKSETTDFLADYDVTLFVTDASTYLTDPSWMHDLDQVWVAVADKICVSGQQEYHTRLVIFDGDIKVDFAFFTTDVLTNFEAQGDLVSRFAHEYKVLLDKDGLTQALSASIIKTPSPNKPSQQEFETVVKEFFFEAYHVAKYLHRNELWLVKFRDWATKEFLLRMLEWHTKAQLGWNYDTLYQGKHIQSWVDKETWMALDKCFAPFGAEDSWKALMATIELFRHVGKQTAKSLGYQYPTDVDENITDFVLRIRHGKD